MDVLNAVLIPIDDRVYRLIPIHGGTTHVEEEEEHKPTRNYIEDDDDDDYDCDLPVVHQGDRFYITINIPNPLIPHIIGVQRRTLKRLEQPGAKINIPGGNSDELTISGFTRAVVCSTYHRVMDQVNTSRLRKESTHFISLPINSSNIQKSFLIFKEEILEKCKKGRGIEESIFQKPNKLHVTVTPLVLLDERDNQKAIAILTECSDNILKQFGEKKIVVQVKGIEIMNDDPSEVDVLYAKVQELDDDNSLQIIADKIMKAFHKANLSKDKYDRVKLHITLMNTLFRDKLETTDGDGATINERQTFDARPIFRDYEDYDFGQIVVSEIHISVRYTEASNGYYIPIKKIKLKT